MAKRKALTGSEMVKWLITFQYGKA